VCLIEKLAKFGIGPEGFEGVGTTWVETLMEGKALVEKGEGLLRIAQAAYRDARKNRPAPRSAR
jgi:hypothetical protein